MQQSIQMSNVPPPFEPQMGARKKDNTGLIIMVVIAVIVGACLLIGGAVAFFGWTAFKNVTPTVGCLMNYEVVHKALKEYATEHEGKLPPASSWQDELRPYVKKAMNKIKSESEGMGDMFKLMDADKPWGCDLGNGQKSGMAFNSDYSARAVDSIESKSTTVLIFETPDAPAANLNKPYQRLDPQTSPSIMGQARGWGIITWEDADMDTPSGSNFRTRTKID